MDILLVEDSATDRMVMQRRLQRAFGSDQIVVAGEGFEFNEVLRRSNMDVVLTDYWLGWGDGLSILQRARKRWPRCKVIFLTGNGGEEVVAEAFKYGLFYYLLKPDGFEHLEAVIQTALDTKRREDQCELTAAVVDGISEAIVGVDACGKIKLWNAGAERLYGYAAGEILGQDAELLVPLNLRTEAGRLAMRALRGERIDPFETTRLRRDGGRVSVELSMAPVRASGGEITAMAIVARGAVAAARSARESKAPGRARGGEAPARAHPETSRS